MKCIKFLVWDYHMPKIRSELEKLDCTTIEECEGRYYKVKVLFDKLDYGTECDIRKTMWKYSANEAA